MVAAIDEARNAGRHAGRRRRGRVSNVPMGLGSHVHWDRKIDGLLAQAWSITA
jgi:chorismate synthase